MEERPWNLTLHNPDPTVTWVLGLSKFVCFTHGNNPSTRKCDNFTSKSHTTWEMCCYSNPHSTKYIN